jgi:hypothetical protein
LKKWSPWDSTVTLHQSVFEYRHILLRTVAELAALISFVRVNRNDKREQTDLIPVFRCWSWMDLRGVFLQGARDVKVGEHHIRGSLEGLVVGTLESVPFKRRAGQVAHLGHKVRNVFMCDVKRVVV